MWEYAWSHHHRCIAFIIVAIVSYIELLEILTSSAIILQW